MASISAYSAANPKASLEQYKSYIRSLNIEQYGAGVLMSALNENQAAAEDSESTDQSSGLDEFFNAQAAKVNINTESVKKKLWSDLETEIKGYEAQHPDIKGKYIVAVNAEDENDQPAFQVADKQTVVGLINETDQKASDALITEHPVQIFKSETIDVSILKSAGFAELKDIVSAFMQKNKGVFQFLFNQEQNTTAALSDNSSAPQNLMNGLF